MKFELSRLARNCSNEEIISEIQRVDLLVDKETLSQKDFNKNSKVYSQTVSKRFGSWKKALVAAGLEHKYTELPEIKKIRGQKFSNEQLIAEAQRIAKQLKQESLTIEDFRLYSDLLIHPESVRRRFGSWAILMKAANLNLSPNYPRRLSNEEYFENLLKVWTHHGRQPFHREIEQYPSTISPGAYEGRFGSWRKALEAFVARMNTETVEADEEVPRQEPMEIKAGETISKKTEAIERAIKSEDRRGINLSLRYKVLVRDNFKCVRCGRSPVTNHGTELHVDHKRPFSKGGKTTLENLETKCKECNLGKGNRHIEDEAIE
jgi:hypothetical protein